MIFPPSGAVESLAKRKTLQVGQDVEFLEVFIHSLANASSAKAREMACRIE
jgi:hypothetical protein